MVFRNSQEIFNILFSPMESLEKYMKNVMEEGKCNGLDNKRNIVVHKRPKFAYTIRTEVKWYGKIIIENSEVPSY